MTKPPLHDIRVLDLSRVLAGPYCTQLLADLGADVIKVEPPAGDDTRRFGPPFVNGESTYFLSINHGKRSIAVDLKQDAGKQVVRDLAVKADVAVENFRPGVADKLGVGYEALRAIHPQIVYASISGYGRRGVAPYNTLPGYDLVIQGIGGIPSLTGASDGPPQKMGTSVADMVAGLNAFGGIMAALYQRERAGEGCLIDISMLDGQLSLLSYHASAWLNGRQRPERLGNAHPSICPYETFAAEDGFINVACGNDAQFAKLCATLGVPELPAQERFATNAARVSNRSVLAGVLGQILGGESVATWLERIGIAGIPCGPINEVPEALAHPQAEARGLLVETPHVIAGPVRTVGSPMGFERPALGLRAPPRLGEHSLEILNEVLGYEPARVRELTGCGAVVALDAAPAAE